MSSVLHVLLDHLLIKGVFLGAGGVAPACSHLCGTTYRKSFDKLLPVSQ